MNEKQFKETMARYLEEHGVWSELVPVLMETADQTPGGLLELAYYVLDQGQGLTQSGLVEMALHIGKGGDTA